MPAGAVKSHFTEKKLQGNRFIYRSIYLVKNHWSETVNSKLGAGAPLFVDQTVARRAGKDFQTDFPPPPPPPISGSG